MMVALQDFRILGEFGSLEIVLIDHHYCYWVRSNYFRIIGRKLIPK